MTTDPVANVPAPVVLPQQTGVEVAKTGQRNAAETAADLAAGQRRVLRRKGELVKAFAGRRAAAGRKIHGFQTTVKGEPGADS